MNQKAVALEASPDRVRPANPIGVMQGRLSPKTDGRFQSFPKDSWRQEFARAVNARLDRIEWIYDFDTADLNPLSTKSGIAEMLALSRSTGVEIRSICADGFMVERLIADDGSVNQANLEKLHWLIEQAHQLGAVYMVMPFVDISSLKTPAQREAALEMFLKLTPRTQENVFELHVEADFNPVDFKKFIETVDSPGVKVNYDTGNSAGLGYDTREELEAYGEKIGSVHIKDRVKGGSTVPLGQGNANLPLTLKLLKEFNYQRHFILQAARRTEGQEVETVKGYVEQLRRMLTE